MRLTLFTLIASLFLPQLASAIVGGLPAEPGAWRSVVFLPGGCTGTLIHPEVVLYAAHCGIDIEYVGLGDSSEQLELKAPVRYCRAFDGEELRAGFDFAYCRLESPQAVTVATPLSRCEAAALTRTQAVTIVGFGVSRSGTTGIKRVASTSIQCVTPAGELLIGGQGVDACSGDSGGPALVRSSIDGQWHVAGVASSGSLCGQGGYFSRIDRVISWLEADTGLTFASAATSVLGYNSSGTVLESCAVADGTVDREPPSLSLVDWDVGDSALGEPELRVRVKSADAPGGCGLEKIGIRVDGRENAPFPPGNGTLTIPLADGEHEIALYARDRARNQGAPLCLAWKPDDAGTLDDSSSGGFALSEVSCK